MTIVASSSSSPNKMITLKSSDGGVFEVEESMAFLSETIELAIAENSYSSTVQLQDVNSSVLAAIIWYMNEVSSGRKSADGFLKELSHDQEMLFGVLKAAYSLKIEALTHSLCQTIADMMMGKSTQEMRDLFHIKCDYTEAELKQVMEETSFCRV